MAERPRLHLPARAPPLADYPILSNREKPYVAEKDKRTYVRLHDGLPDHPKIIAVGGEAAWMYTSALCYCSRHLTDGYIPRRLWARLTDSSNPEANASALVRSGLLHEEVHSCTTCPPGLPDQYLLHDYLDHQRSAAEVQELRDKRSLAGQMGGKRSGESRRASSGREANGEALASDLLKQTRSKTEAETETETEKKEKKSRRSRRTESELNADRPDVDQICRHIVAGLVATGSNRPEITQEWRTSARLLIDRDKVTVERACRAFDWAIGNNFWQAHILTPMKLREKYETLRRQAHGERTPRLVAPAAPTSPRELDQEVDPDALQFG